MRFNGIPPTVHRNLAWVDVPMADIKIIRRAFGAKVNDVALALNAGALHRYLEQRGELPEVPLVIANPVNIRAADDSGAFENRVSMMTVQLPTNIADPADRLRQVVTNTTAAKAKISGAGTNMFEDLFDVVAPGLTGVIVQLAATRLGQSLPPAYNVCITNLVGPPFPLYLCGARLEGFRIQMMQALGVGLVVAMISYDGALQMSITGSRELIPDVWSIATGIDQERALLLDAANT